MIATIHQPEYLPWIGFFDRIDKADIFIILNDVGYQKKGFINKNKIKNSDEWQWLTIPVKAVSQNKKINQILIDNQKNWGEEHWKAIFYNYKKALYFEKYSSFLKAAFKKKWEFLADLDIYFIENIIKMLGIKTKIIKSSDLKSIGGKTSRLVNICKEIGADTYLSGPGGKDHMDLEEFKKENIGVLFQEFKHPEYPQRFVKNGFIPKMSILDLLFNCGDKSLDIIRSSNKNI